MFIISNTYCAISSTYILNYPFKLEAGFCSASKLVALPSSSHHHFQLFHLLHLFSTSHLSLSDYLSPLTTSTLISHLLLSLALASPLLFPYCPAPGQWSTPDLGSGVG